MKFIGPFKDDINNYLEYRQLKKQKIGTVISELTDFDIYTTKVKSNGVLSRELVENWLILRENENPKTLNKRIYAMRVFSKYLKLMGKTAFEISPEAYLKYSIYIPHIYTKEEINIFFKTIDIKIENTNCYPYLKKQITLFFKLLYCCGLRFSELINLKYNNIDLKNSSLLIEKSKNDISRVIFINDNLLSDLKKYIKDYSNNKSSEYLFYNFKTNNIMSSSIIRQCFAKIKEATNVDPKCRIHDFRHTFAVENIKKAWERGENNILVTLMNYMGHSDIKSTEYYLRFTPDVYSKIIEQNDCLFNDVIPRIIGEKDE